MIYKMLEVTRICTFLCLGFCIFNFAAGAAFYALNKHNLSRVGMLDFDVHYGNGIADLVQNEPRIR